MTLGFDELMCGLDYPMYIVTAAGEGDISGCLVGFTTQSSIDPSRFLVCLSHKNRTFRIASRAEYLAVHLVPKTRADLAEVFGELTSDDTDKLGLCDWERGPNDLPIVTGCPNWFVGRIVDRFPLGDHDGFLLAPEVVNEADARIALSSSDVSHMLPGHEP
jgi:flavin reductase (DIM6/NTAB) family NADH-FMN oxidoreductase RutF